MRFDTSDTDPGAGQPADSVKATKFLWEIGDDPQTEPYFVYLSFGGMREGSNYYHGFEYNPAADKPGTARLEVRLHGTAAVIPFAKFAYRGCGYDDYDSDHEGDLVFDVAAQSQIGTVSRVPGAVNLYTSGSLNDAWMYKGPHLYLWFYVDPIKKLIWGGASFGTSGGSDASPETSGWVNRAANILRNHAPVGHNWDDGSGGHVDPFDAGFSPQSFDNADVIDSGVTNLQIELFQAGQGGDTIASGYRRCRFDLFECWKAPAKKVAALVGHSQPGAIRSVLNAYSTPDVSWITCTRGGASLSEPDLNGVPDFYKKYVNGLALWTVENDDETTVNTYTEPNLLSFLNDRKPALVCTQPLQDPSVGPDGLPSAVFDNSLNTRIREIAADIGAGLLDVRRLVQTSKQINLAWDQDDSPYYQWSGRSLTGNFSEQCLCANLLADDWETMALGDYDPNDGDTDPRGIWSLHSTAANSTSVMSRSIDAVGTVTQNVFRFHIWRSDNGATLYATHDLSGADLSSGFEAEVSFRLRHMPRGNTCDIITFRDASNNVIMGLEGYFATGDPDNLLTIRDTSATPRDLGKVSLQASYGKFSIIRDSNDHWWARVGDAPAAKLNFNDPNEDGNGTHTAVSTTIDHVAIGKTEAFVQGAGDEYLQYYIYYAYVKIGTNRLEIGKEGAGDPHINGYLGSGKVVASAMSAAMSTGLSLAQHRLGTGRRRLGW
jgi:hypothetical protein